ncbi:MAG: hypothetical protein AB1635_15355 [Acidobacteriota bacterium]
MTGEAGRSETPNARLRGSLLVAALSLAALALGLAATGGASFTFGGISLSAAALASSGRLFHLEPLASAATSAGAAWSLTPLGWRRARARLAAGRGCRH